MMTYDKKRNMGIQSFGRTATINGNDAMSSQCESYKTYRYNILIYYINIRHVILTTQGSQYSAVLLEIIQMWFSSFMWLILLGQSWLVWHPLVWHQGTG